MTAREKTCFVIMPFGQKRIGEVTVDFDRIYSKLFGPALRYAGYEPVRGDELGQSGPVMDPVYERIANEEIVVADITGLNPNVMYELGVRHTLRPKTTILIRCADVESSNDMPFDLNTLRYIAYRVDLSDYQSFRTQLGEFTRNQHGENNPAFRKVAEAKARESETLTSGAPVRYRVVQPEGQPGRELWLCPGDIRSRAEFDVWVNPENTAMQMARHYEQSISATIRYWGSVRGGEGGRPKKDTVAAELRKAMGRRLSVDIGEVMVTGSGELKASNQVQKIFHVATVTGRAGRGYRMIDGDDGRSSVENVLRELDKRRYNGLSSVLFPLFGTGNAGRPVEDVAPNLIDAAARYLHGQPRTRIARVGFTARSQRDFDVCRNFCDDLVGAGLLETDSPPVVRSRRATRPRSNATPGAAPDNSVDVQLVREVFSDVFGVVEAQLRYRRPDGTMSPVVKRLSFERGDSAAAVVVDKDRGVVLLTRQFRYPATQVTDPHDLQRPAEDPVLLEVPAGSVRDDETPDECMRRELEEELGYRVSSLEPINSFYVSPGGTSERIFLFYAEVAWSQRVNDGGGVGDEEIEIVERPVAEVRQLLAGGEIHDAKTLIGLTWLAERAGPA